MSLRSCGRTPLRVLRRAVGSACVILAGSTMPVATAAASEGTALPPPPAVDIPPATGRFAVFGDYGLAGPNEAAVADLVLGRSPTAIVTTGDNSYGPGPIDTNIGQYYSSYIGDYAGSYGTGSAVNRFFPAVGNHDYSDGGGISAYLSYFTLPGNERYYDIVVGAVHLFFVNANPGEPDGTSATSAQGQWLQAQLAASTAPYQVVVMHHPPYSSSANHGSSAWMQWPYEDWGADLVLAGHDHTYERIVRDDNSDQTELTYVVSGLGGRSLYGFPPSGWVSGSQVRFDDDYGALFLQACASRVTGTFLTAGGATIDGFTLPGDTTAPPPSPPHGFPDVPAWADEAVQWLVDPAHAYATGYADGTYRAVDPASRGAATLLLYRLAGSPDTSPFGPHGFTDVPTRLDEAVQWATHDPDGGGPQKAPAEGFGDGTYRPRVPITRGELTRMLFRFVGSPDVSALPEPPFGDVPGWLADSVRWAADPCPQPPTATGYLDGTFRPGVAITRAELSRMLYRALT